MYLTRIVILCWAVTSASLLRADLAPITLQNAVGDPPACMTQILTNYVALGRGGCVIGDKIFFNFGYNQTGGGIAQGAVTVTPEPVQPDGVGIDFSGNWSGALQNSITYSVRSVSGNAIIKDSLLSVNGMAQTQRASFTVFESLCFGRDSFPMVANCNTPAMSTVSSIANSSMPLVNFNPVSVLAVQDTLSLNVFQAGGQTSVSRIDNFLSETPEPSFFGMIAILGLGLAGQRIRMRRKAAKD